jgi:hypothetical protein
MVDFKKRFDKVAIADGNQLLTFLFVIKDLYVAERLQAAAETVSEFACAFGHPFVKADMASNEYYKFVLVTDIKGSQDDGFGLF